MSDPQAPPFQPFDSALLAQLGELEVTAALTTLSQRNLLTLATGQQLVDAALRQAETDPRLAAHWLSIADQLNQSLGNDSGLLAQTEYAQARLATLRNDLAAAEALVHQAQARWRVLGDQAALTRSNLGLTQILTSQGRYLEAEATIRQALTGLESDTSSISARLQALRARINLATLLAYQERHRETLAECTAIREQLVTLQQQSQGDAQVYDAIDEVVAQVDWTRATALMYLDEPNQAEVALQSALAICERLADRAWSSGVRATLGGLYLRTGRYATALSTFDQAESDLLGAATTADALSSSAENQDNVLLVELERAFAYLALNLLTEATSALERCETLYRRAGQPYELGQTLLALGGVYLRTQNTSAAQTALQEAESAFLTLQNPYWVNRTRVALAHLAYQRGELPEAANALAILPTALTSQSTANAKVDWDMATLVEGWLLRLRLQLEAGDLPAAQQIAVLVGAFLAPKPAEPMQTLWPHLQLRLQHALGRIAWRAQNYAEAEAHLTAALDLLEAQRTALPLEEVRTAYLDDKLEIYNDLLRVQLERPDASSDVLASAFATIERARSRALLERLLTTVEPPTDPTDPQQAARLDEVRQRLHWLYNQLLGEQGSRHVDGDLSREIQTLETVVQQLEWRQFTLLAQAQPVRLEMLQAALAPDQQAVLYYMIEDEILAFVVRHDHALLKRQIGSVATLQSLQAELNFQMGRAELGHDYLMRHAERLRSALQAVLCQIYRLLIAPLEAELTLPRLLLIPFGSLHLLPIHALWDGEHYLLEQFECAYAPSAGVAVYCQRWQPPGQGFASFAGLAVSDAAIPQARAEVEAAAHFFPVATVYAEEAADQAGLVEAVQQAEVVHLATHGLFRPDNPFFSALKLADGWIDVRAIYRLPLAAQLVVLSACQSGAGRIQGADEVIGLARGFLGAGAHALLVSLWNVHDASAVQFMVNFYQALTSTPAQHPAAALRTAQLTALQEQQHPYYWAPFLVIG